VKIAAIDIGSNAARLLINDVVEEDGKVPQFIKVALVRVPLRLGFDVFESGTISPQKAKHLTDTVKAYKLLMDVYEVAHLKTAATSAMRDADNAAGILAQVKAETGIDIKVISGEEEATYIYENGIAESLSKDGSYLYIDVGGGSTELTFFSDGKLAAKQSFNIGTIRLLKNQVSQTVWNAMKGFIEKETGGNRYIKAIGSGGNINKIFSLSKRKEGKPLNLELLRNYYKELGILTVLERTRLYGMREDRADVIVPALLIYINVMRWAGADEIFVPKIGLADGLTHLLYHEIKKGK
jgi:exopolyphosphatase/guanosine-5'-triphosphate,3'-diphosphate pyrophosphatase